jgi:outer membrane biogenesis lipoprotein LolB
MPRLHLHLTVALALVLAACTPTSEREPSQARPEATQPSRLATPPGWSTAAPRLT